MADLVGFNLKMQTRIVVLILACLILSASVVLAQEPTGTLQEKLQWLQQEVTRLEAKSKTKLSEKIKVMMEEKLSLYTSRIKELEQELEAVSEYPSAEVVTAEAEVQSAPRKVRFSCEMGVVAGMLEGGSYYLLETRFPLKYIIGPAKTSFRLSTGLAQSKSADKKYIPLGADLILNYPPGVFTGLDNYLGVGLNYVVLTSGRKSGTVGGQVSYGVQAEGFKGLIFGEVGYGILRSDFIPNNQGLIVMVGYRSKLEF